MEISPKSFPIYFAIFGIFLQTLVEVYNNSHIWLKFGMCIVYTVYTIQAPSYRIMEILWQSFFKLYQLCWNFEAACSSVMVICDKFAADFAIL